MARKSHIKTTHRSPKRTQPKGSEKGEAQPVQAGIAWFRAEQYPHFLAIVVDASKRHDTYLEWLDSALEQFTKLRALGLQVVKVEVDVNEFEHWCRAQGCAIDGSACAAFVSYKLASGEAVILS